MIPSSPEKAQAQEELSASTKAYEYLRAEIVGGRLVGDTILVEQDIAQRLNISRTPVHDALRRLGAEGLVIVEPRRRARVTSLTHRDTDQIYKIRAELEALAAECAAEAADTAAIDRLDRLAKQMEAIAGEWKQEHVREFIETNSLFHLEILAAASNPWLEKSLRPILDLSLGPAPRLTGGYGDEQQLEVLLFLNRNCRQHREVIEAIRAKDPIWAKAAMLTHVHAAHHDWGGTKEHNGATGPQSRRSRNRSSKSIAR